MSKALSHTIQLPQRVYGLTSVTGWTLQMRGPNPSTTLVRSFSAHQQQWGQRHHERHGDGAMTTRCTIAC